MYDVLPGLVLNLVCTLHLCSESCAIPFDRLLTLALACPPRARYVSGLRWRGLVPLAEDIDAQLSAAVGPPRPLMPGLLRRPPRAPRGRAVGRRQPLLSLPMPQGSMVAIPRSSPLAVCRPKSPQFSPAESEEKLTATDSTPTQSPAADPAPCGAEVGGGETPRLPDPPRSEAAPYSPVDIKSEICSAKESPQVPLESLELAEPASPPPHGSQRSDADGDELASTRSEPARPLMREVPPVDQGRPESVPILPPRPQLSFEFEPPPRAAGVSAHGAAGEPSGPATAVVGLAPDELQLLRVRQRLEQLAARSAAGVPAAPEGRIDAAPAVTGGQMEMTTGRELATLAELQAPAEARAGAWRPTEAKKERWGPTDGRRAEHWTPAETGRELQLRPAEAEEQSVPAEASREQWEPAEEKPVTWSGGDAKAEEPEQTKPSAEEGGGRTEPASRLATRLSDMILANEVGALPVVLAELFGTGDQVGEQFHRVCTQLLGEYRRQRPRLDFTGQLRMLCNGVRDMDR